MIQELLARKGEFSDFARRLKRERIPDIVDLFNTKTVEETAKILADLPDEQAVGVFDRAGARLSRRIDRGDPAPQGRAHSHRHVVGPGGGSFPPAGRARPHGAVQAARCRYQGLAQPRAALSDAQRRFDHDDRIRQRARRLDGGADAGPCAPRRAQPRDGVCDLYSRSRAAHACAIGELAPPDRGGAGSRRAVGGARNPSAHRFAADRPRRGRAAYFQIRSAGRAGGGRRAGDRHRHGRRHDRRDPAGERRGRSEIRRHGGDRRALHADRFRPHDPQARAAGFARCS